MYDNRVLSFLSVCFRAEAYAEKSEFVLPFSLFLSLILVFMNSDIVSEKRKATGCLVVVERIGIVKFIISINKRNGRVMLMILTIICLFQIVVRWWEDCLMWSPSWKKRSECVTVI